MPYMGYEDLNKSTKIGINGIIALAKDNGFDFEIVDNGVKLLDPNGRDQTFTERTTAGAVGRWMGYNTGGIVEGKETNKKTGDLFSSIGALVGLVAGGPAGAALGGGLGALLGGANPQQAIQAGIGSLFPAMTMGKMGLAGNVLGAMGGGPGPQQRGAGLMGMLSGQPTNPMSMVMGGGPTAAVPGIMQALGVRNAQGQEDPIMASILREMLDQQRRPRFENLMTDLEREQFRTGERRPDYRGTPVMRAQGGYIEGPGTGTSDSIPAAIYQNGGRVQEAALSDGEFVMTEAAVRGAGGGDRDAGAAKMYRMMDQFERRA